MFWLRNKKLFVNYALLSIGLVDCWQLIRSLNIKTHFRTSIQDFVTYCIRAQQRLKKGLYIFEISPEPLVFAYTKYGRR